MRITDMPEFKDKREVLSFDLETPLCEAIKEMAAKNYGAVLVTENDKLTGIFTERDLLCRVAGEDRDFNKLLIKDVMTKNLKTAKENDLVADCLRRMSQGRFRHMPVTDENGHILGMLSQGDFVAFTMSDIVGRLGASAQATIQAGRFTPLSIIIAVMVYTLMMLFILASVDHLAFMGGE